MLRHRRWAGHGVVSGHSVEFHPGGKYVHPQNAGAGGSYLRNDVGLVFWEGREDFHRIAVKAVVHPIPGDYSFLLAHGVQSTKFVQALICSRTSGIRRCNNGGYDTPTYPDGTEAVFAEDASASSYSFDTSNAQQMSDATERIGFKLLYNDNTRPGWTYADEDGSFLLKHKTKPMILVSEARGGAGDANRIRDGDRLVWRLCPTNCVNDFSRDEFFTYGFVFENFLGQVCLPPGV